MKEGEPRIELAADTALAVYCATCAHVLIELAADIEGKHSLARLNASDHWNAYKENHTVLVISTSEHRVEHITDTNEFVDIINND